MARRERAGMGIFQRKDRGSNNWYIQYFFQGRRIRERVGPGRRMAERALAMRKAEIVQGRFNLEGHSRAVLFDEILNDFLKVSETNKRSYKRDLQLGAHLRGFFGGRDVRRIAPALIEEYKAKRLSEGVKGATVNRELSLMRTCFNWAIKGKKVKENPVRQIKFFPEPAHRPRFLDEEEYGRLMAASPPQLRPVVFTAVTTGMRVGEILGLKWEHVDFNRGLIHVDGTKSGKGRQVPVCGALRRVLEECREASGKAPYVFLARHGRHYTSVRTAFENALRRAGIKGLTFHDLRHTAASWMVMAGVDLVTVKEILGHATIQMTLRYSHVSSSHKRNAVEVLGAKAETGCVSVREGAPAGATGAQGREEQEGRLSRIYHLNIV